MDIFSHIYQVLQDMAEDTRFQLWIHDGHQQTSTFIGGDKYIQNEPCFFTDLDSFTLPTKKWTKAQDHTILYFLYSMEYQVAICFFQPSFSLPEPDQKTLFYLFQHHRLEEIVAQRNMELHTIIESMNSVTASLQLENVLKEIIKHALTLISPSDAGYLLLYNEAHKRLEIKASIGFSQDMLTFQPNIGEGITGKVFEDGKGRLYHSSEEIDQQMRNFQMSQANLSAIYNKDFIEMEGIICAPVTMNGSRIGVIAIHQQTVTNKLTKHDLYLLEVFAGQAGIAIQNAQLHTDAIERLNQTSMLSKKLQEKNMILKQRYDVHERLMAISLKNEGIQMLLHTVSEIIDRPILFFNHLELNFYHYKWRSKEPIFSIFEIKKIFHHHMQPVDVRISNQDGKEMDLHLYPISNGGVLLGCFILQVDEALSHSDRITLQQGSSAIALEIVRKQSDLQSDQQKMHADFHHLMNLDHQTELHEIQKKLGLDKDAYWITAILEIPVPFLETKNISFQIYQLASQLDRTLSEIENYYYISYNQIIIFISLRHPSEANTIFQDIQSLKQMRIQDDIPGFRGGLSDIHYGLQHLKTSFEEANQALAYSAKHRHSNLINYEDIGLHRLFLNQSTSDIHKFVDEVFAPLDQDNERHQDLDRTLQTYIECGRSATQSAEKLHIHKNTLYQRIKSMEELLDINLNNHEEYLELQLAYHLRNQMKIGTY